MQMTTGNGQHRPNEDLRCDVTESVATRDVVRPAELLRDQDEKESQWTYNIFYVDLVLAFRRPCLHPVATRP